MSNARRFRKFLECDAAETTAAPAQTVRKRKVNVDAPTPCASEVELYLSKWDELEHYRLQEDALDKLFLCCARKTKIFPMCF